MRVSQQSTEMAKAALTWPDPLSTWHEDHHHQQQHHRDRHNESNDNSNSNGNGNINQRHAHFVRSPADARRWGVTETMSQFVYVDHRPLLHETLCKPPAGVGRCCSGVNHGDRGRARGSRDGSVPVEVGHMQEKAEGGYDGEEARREACPVDVNFNRGKAVGRQTKQHSDTKGDTNKPNAASDARRSAGSHYNKVTRTTSGVKRGEHRPNRKKSGAEAEQQRDGRLQEEKEKMNQYFSREIGGPVRDSGRTRGGTRGGDAESACRHNITSEKQFGASTVRSGGTGAVRRRRAKTTKPLARPVFFAYGNGNTAPSTGGVVYGNYMLSHSIIPQVLPNRPRTRQVYLGTEREAVKASVKAKTRFNRKKTSTRERLVNLNASGAVPRTQNAFGHNCESRRSGYGGGGYATRRVAAAGELEGDGLEHGSLDSGSCSSVFDPVANFSALPADTKRWNHPRRPAADRIILEKSPSSLTVNATAGFPSPRRSFSNREKPIGFGGPSSLDQGQPALIPIQGDAHRELDDNRAEKRADVESEDYEKEEVGLDHDPRDSDNDEHSAKFDCIAAAPRPWTAGDLCNPNDPRSYKFLPRGWERALITPAGVSGSAPPTAEALLLLGGRGLRKGRGDVHRYGGEVRDCLKWDRT